MSVLPPIRLKKNEDRRIRAGHLWVYSNEIDVGATPISQIEPGEPVVVQDSRGGFLGTGYLNPHSLIAARIVSRRRSDVLDRDLFLGRIRLAASLRDCLFSGEPYYRLVFGEGDGIPGLVVDRYGETLVVQPTTAGADRLMDTILPVLAEATGAENILLRADSPIRAYENLDSFVGTALGTVPDEVSVLENGVRFRAPALDGQKTGWFYDHRQNRGRLRHYVSGTRVLDVFSYVGAWGVQALAFGAREAVCVDASAPALAGAERNADSNGVANRLRVARGDAFAVLQQMRDAGERFDVVILDPPAFVKRKKDLREGEQAYRRINRLALDLLPRGGILVSASCSFHFDRVALLRAILWAAMKTGREIQIVEEGHQAADHPVHPAIPETAYLKVFFVRVLS